MARQSKKKSPKNLFLPGDSERHQKSGTKKSGLTANKGSHPNQLLTVDDRKRRLQEALNCLSAKQREIVYANWPEIARGIDYALQRGELSEFDRLFDIKESYEYELVTKHVNDILEGNVSNRKIVNWAKGLALKRKPSWHNCLFRQRESIRLRCKPCKIEYDETGNIADLGFADAEWMPIVNPPNPFAATAEDLVINKELSTIIRQLPSIVGSSKRKRASEYQRILQLQLSGVDVKRKHAKQLGIKSDQVASRKHQAIKFAGQILAEIFPDLKEAQAVFRVQKAKSWNVERSTFEKRKALYRKPYCEEMQPRTIRVWGVVDGNGPDFAKSGVVQVKAGTN